MHGLDGAFCPENNRSFVPLRFSRSHALSHPLEETPSYRFGKGLGAMPEVCKSTKKK